MKHAALCTVAQSSLIMTRMTMRELSLWCVVTRAHFKTISTPELTARVCVHTTVCPASKEPPKTKTRLPARLCCVHSPSSVCSTECSPPIGQEAGILVSDWSIKCLASNRSRPVHCRARLLLSNSRRPAVLCICTLVCNFVFLIARLTLCKHSRKTNWLLL